MNECDWTRDPGAEAASWAATAGFFVFLCNDSTEEECYERALFGAPAKFWDNAVDHVEPGTTLILYNFAARTLSGPYEALTAGTLTLTRPLIPSPHTVDVKPASTRRRFFFLFFQTPPHQFCVTAHVNHHVCEPPRVYITTCVKHHVYIPREYINTTVERLLS